MTFNDLIKTTEGLVVLVGLFLTVTLGKFWAIATGVTYVLLNVPKAWNWLKNLRNKI